MRRIKVLKKTIKLHTDRHGVDTREDFDYNRNGVD